MQLGTVPAWIAAALSFIFGLQSWLSSRKSKAEREEAVRQAERAERAVEAAQRQAHAAERVVALQEAHDQQQIERAEAAEERPFELVPIPGDDNGWLHNTTEAPKYGVQVAGIHVRSAPKRVDVIERGQKKVIDIGRFGQRPGRDHRIHITWHRKQDLSDPVLRQDDDLPPRIG
jgi:hypothetical protein